MVSDPNFTVDELAAISAGYARLLEEGGALVAELKTVITGGNGLSLSDKERMDVVDQVYTKMLEYRTSRAITRARPSPCPSSEPRKGRRAPGAGTLREPERQILVT